MPSESGYDWRDDLAALDGYDRIASDAYTRVARHIVWLEREREAQDALITRAERALAICAEWASEASGRAVMRVPGDTIAELAYRQAVSEEES